MAVRFAVSLLVLALASQACNKGSNVDESPAPESGPNDPSANGAGAQADTTGGAGGPSMAMDPATLKLGDDVFHGRKANGSCYACHGSKGKGTGVAPALDDSEWLNGDGSQESIATVIREGVPTPKKSSAPMPPMGGTKLSDQQIDAVAAYVYSLSHK